eukprot:PhF_6_TR34260/c0_g1_i1/m.50249
MTHQYGTSILCRIILLEIALFSSFLHAQSNTEQLDGIYNYVGVFTIANSDIYCPRCTNTTTVSLSLNSGRFEYYSYPPYSTCSVSGTYSLVDGCLVFSPALKGSCQHEFCVGTSPCASGKAFFSYEWRRHYHYFEQMPFHPRASHANSAIQCSNSICLDEPKTDLDSRFTKSNRQDI